MKKLTVHVHSKRDSQLPGAGSSREVIAFQFDNLSRNARLAHLVYTRHGGVSEPPYHSLNTSFDGGDRPENIEANLRIITAGIGAAQMGFMNQRHGKDVSVVRRDTFEDVNGPIDADAIITDVMGLALMVKQADCQAVILFDPVTGVIANIHCGWRGNTHNIIGAVVNRMTAEFECRPADLLAAIGPSLGPCCAEFVTHKQLFPRTFDRFMVRRDYFDLWEISRWQLLEAGLKRENIETAGICTRCRTDLFYSYRAEGTTGRFATVVMLK